ncbi:alpha-ketoacid dehydrogenase subunit beta [Verrucomicrobia bacterium]|nr:alpha-ketoacid dehydrogenase subunit beta [Verrucomicrobiota bacterium]
MGKNLNYGEAICSGFQYLLKNYPEVFCIGQGLWSPWYVGNSMTNLEVDFGKERILDSPVSELGCTGAALGAALSGYRPIVIHPRVDFFLLAVDQLVNQAAKWRHMFGGSVSAPLTVRAVINRGGEQGAQHSQALHSWFAHIPGLRVVMPATPLDARDLLISSVLCDDPVLYIDDRWLYDATEEEVDIQEIPLQEIGPVCRRQGTDVTIAGCSYSVKLALEAAEKLQEDNISCEVIDLRVINPLDLNLVRESVRKTGRLVAVDGDWTNCGLAGEIIAGVTESSAFSSLKATPKRVTLVDAPAPTSKPLEQIYYPTSDVVAGKVRDLLNK